MKTKNIQTKNYSYGRVNKRLKDAVVWLNKNKKAIMLASRQGKYPYEDCFDYPDYWNMPKKISNRLDGDEVDWIQEKTYYWWKHWW